MPTNTTLVRINHHIRFAYHRRTMATLPYGFITNPSKFACQLGVSVQAHPINDQKTAFWPNYVRKLDIMDILPRRSHQELLNSIHKIRFFLNEWQLVEMKLTNALDKDTTDA